MLIKLTPGLESWMVDLIRIIIQFSGLDCDGFGMDLEWIWNGFGMDLEWIWNGFGMDLEWIVNPKKCVGL